MMRLVVAVAFAALAAVPVSGQAPAFNLAEVKALYLRADYDGALRLLTRADPTTDPDIKQVEEYRALCLLALGRVKEAEQAVERIIARVPLYQVNPDQVSPRMVALVASIRQRHLPVLARSLYGLARKNIEHRQYAAAASQLEEVLALTDAAGPEAGLDDIQFLAEGFLAIAQGQLKAASAPPPGPVAASSMGSAGLMTTVVYSDFLKLAENQSAAARGAGGPTESDPEAPLVVRPDIYSDADRIQPPVPVQRNVPPWRPPDAEARQGTHRGKVELVVSERGTVEAASIAESVHEAYDAALLEAAQTWRYRPATRNGEPVRYRLQTDVVLRPPAESTGKP